MNLLEHLKQIQADCEPTACAQYPLEFLCRLEELSEELVNITLDIRLRVRAGKRHWHQPWAREIRDKAKAAELLKELEGI